MLDDRISALIGRIYTGVHDPKIWDGVLDDILDLTNSRFVLVSAVDLKSGEYSHHRFHGADDSRFLDAVRDYGDHYYKGDALLAYGRRYPDAGFASLRQALSDRGVDYDDDSYVAWLREHLGADNSVVCYTPGRDGLTLGVSLHTKAHDAAHGDKDIRLFKMLFGHLEQSVRLASRPPDFVGDAEATLLLDQRGRIVAMNGRAEALLAKGDGIALADGRLALANNDDGRRLNRAIASAMGALSRGGTGGTISIRRALSARSLAVIVSPFVGMEEPFAALLPTVLVRIIDPEEGTLPGATDRWTALYGLTPAEIRLVQNLMAGSENLRHAADAIGIAYATARVQLSSVLDKVGVNSQLQLVRLLTRIGTWVASIGSGVTMLAIEGSVALPI